MKLTLRLDYGEGSPRTITTDLWSVVAWERKTGRKISSLADGVGMEDLCFLAYTTLQRAGEELPPKIDDWIKNLSTLEVVDGGATPTNRATPAT